MPRDSRNRRCPASAKLLPEGKQAHHGFPSLFVAVSLACCSTTGDRDLEPGAPYLLLDHPDDADGRAEAARLRLVRALSLQRFVDRVRVGAWVRPARRTPAALRDPDLAPRLGGLVYGQKSARQ